MDAWHDFVLMSSALQGACIFFNETDSCFGRAASKQLWWILHDASLRRSKQVVGWDL